MLSMLLLSCSDVQAPTLPSAKEVAAAVTGAAAANLDANGKFVLSMPEEDGPYERINVGRARALADAWKSQFGPLLRSFIIEGHGAEVDFYNLKVCGRPFYAESALEPLAPTYHSPARRGYGPWWLVTLCSNSGTPQVSLAISAWATELELVEGRIRFPRESGNEFFAIGIPQGHVGEFPSSPEVVVSFAATKTNKRTAGIPKLVVPLGDQNVPQRARWELRLEEPVRFRAQQSGVLMREAVYVGSRRRDLLQEVAAPTQPAHVQGVYVPFPTPGESAEAYAARREAATEILTIPRKVAVPVMFEIATAEAQ